MASESHSSSTPRPPGVSPDGHRIKRKPVPGFDGKGFTDDANQPLSCLHSPGPFYLKPPEEPPPPYESSEHLASRPPFTSTASSSTVPDILFHEDSKHAHALAARPSVQRAVTDTHAASQSSASTPSPSAVQKAYGETCHFLGGLINHPTASNKHFTILRHSHGVVFYRGSTTSVTVSIFSDSPLPPDSTLWLQNKGWTGKTGMRAKALFRLHDDWIDVTPTAALHVDQVDPANERAWQRDIAKFHKKAPAKVRDTHQLRQTVMARIPIEAGDGYFQLVLCQGTKKKVLCNSPVFRVLSTSMDPSSIRGAGLSTIPLEVGAMILSLYAQAAAKAVLSPAASAVQSKAQAYQPSAAKKTAAQTALSKSNLRDHIGSIFNMQVDQPGGVPIDRPDSLEQGPVAPFPMGFKAQGEPYVDGWQCGLQESPMLNLTRIPDAMLEQLHGYFICWARFYPEEKEKAKTSPTPWYPSILSVLPIDHSTITGVKMSHITKRTTTLRFLEDIHLPLPTHIKLQIRVMCFLRPEMPQPTASSEKELHEAREASAEAFLLADSCDTSYAQTVLDHPAWAPEVQESQKENMRFLDRARDGYSTARTKVEKTPLHWIGIRSAMAEKTEQQVTVNGFYIVR